MVALTQVQCSNLFVRADGGGGGGEGVQGILGEDTVGKFVPARIFNFLNFVVCLHRLYIPIESTQLYLPPSPSPFIPPSIIAAHSYLNCSSVGRTLPS